MTKLILLLLLPLAGFCQHKFDNQIKVRNTSLKQSAAVLLDHGFVIDKYDSVLNFTTTRLKSLGKHRLSMKLTVRVKNDTAFIRGEFMVGGNPYALLPRDANHISYSPVVFYNSSISNSRVCWDAMEAAAKGMGKDLDFAKL